jgi:ribosomal protein S18 acetylase RimI-like enzyme
MEIRAFRSDDGMLMKTIRLRALADASYAFGGPETLAQEAAQPDSHWHQVAAEVGGDVEAWRERCISYVVFDGDEPCGTASSYLCSRIAGRAYFSAAWIDPRYRRRGLGRQLVRRAIDWAAAHGADHLRLWVDDTNPGAAKFYEALGFDRAGENRPVSPGSELRESCFERRLL